MNSRVSSFRTSILHFCRCTPSSTACLFSVDDLSQTYLLESCDGYPWLGHLWFVLPPPFMNIQMHIVCWWMPLSRSMFIATWGVCKQQSKSRYNAFCKEPKWAFVLWFSVLWIQKIREPCEATKGHGNWRLHRAMGSIGIDLCLIQTFAGKCLATHIKKN